MGQVYSREHLLNLQLSLSMKPMLKYMDSIERIRQLVNFSDTYLGRFAVPKTTRRVPVTGTSNRHS